MIFFFEESKVLWNLPSKVFEHESKANPYPSHVSNFIKLSFG